MSAEKHKVVYVCDACGAETPKWEGRCPACKQWNSLSEVRRGRTTGTVWLGEADGAVRELAVVSADEQPRIVVSSKEVNRVLGGGLVPGSVVLIAGDPGIGKSTVLLRLAADLASSSGGALYVSGEESAAQIKMRAERLGISGEGLFLTAATDVDAILDHLERKRPAVALVDSIQTVYDDSISSGAGAASQVRECTRRLMQWAKASETPMVLSGHVTKGGDIAGPRVLEHMVDVVLYMEGDPVSSWRLLRTVKNRFGSANEIGVFEMTQSGLLDVVDPSKALLSERRAGSIGSSIVAVMEGSRPLLAEVQALTAPSSLPTPRRVATGIEFNRLLLVCAVLSRRAGISLSNQDVVVNVAGGLRVSEPAADLGVALAIASSFRNVPLESDLVAIGELGLSGEVRTVPQLHRRAVEAARLGLTRCLLPRVRGLEELPAELDVRTVDTLADAIRASIPRETGKADGDYGPRN
jgi:DNA repair protein RadA/Sms